MPFPSRRSACRRWRPPTCSPPGRWRVAPPRSNSGARPRLLHFDRPDGEATEIAIADADAGCWAEAIDEGYGLQTLPGLALCLRLLALVEILARVPALAPLFDVTPDGIELHPALLDAAATLPLDAGARFDEAAIRRLLSRRLPPGAADRRRIA